MKACSVEGCTNRYLSSGYCSTHYGHIRRYGEIRPRREYMPRGTARLCSVEGCIGKHRAKGYCASHYENVRRTGQPWNLTGEFLPAAPLVSALKEHMGWMTRAELAEQLGISEDNLARLFYARRINAACADRYAIALKSHPVLLWPEEWMAVA